MCGIAGWLGYIPSYEQNALRIAKLLRHRGPDAYGIQHWTNAALIHTRLSIIDLTPTGAQPMSNEDATIWTVFNGEIYNHRQLRRRLESRGHVFKGRSDTEVICHLYEDMGSKFVTELRGMFALAVFDLHTQTLILARDWFGIKPLFYAPSEGWVAFASEVQALLGLPDIDDRPDPQAIYDFAALFSIPAPETFYRGIRALQPGEMLVAKLNEGISWTTRLYHRWTIDPNPALTFQAAVEYTENLIVNAVHRQVESDVSLGAFLSGGIDSSLVCSAAQSIIPDGIHTFNVRFDEEDYDETPAALAVAQHIQSRHTVLEMNNTDKSWEHITSLLIGTGQPFADTSIFAVNAMCRLLRKNITVALGGDGGDEGFGGYNLYQRIPTLATLQKLPFPVWSGLWHGLSQLIALTNHLSIRSHPQLSRRSRLFAQGNDDISVIQGLFRSVSDCELKTLCQPQDLLPISRLFETEWEYRLPVGASKVERLLAHATESNTRLVLANDYLFKVDTASMKESLEVRVPMLDEDLFTFGLSLPYHLKVRARVPKAVLRSVALRRLPIDIASRPKHGFRVPVDRWLTGEFKIQLRETLLESGNELSDFFQPKIYRPLIEAFCTDTPYPTLSRSDLYQRVMMLLATYLGLTYSKTH